MHHNDICINGFLSISRIRTYRNYCIETLKVKIMAQIAWEGMENVAIPQPLPPRKTKNPPHILKTASLLPWGVTRGTAPCSGHYDD